MMKLRLDSSAMGALLSAPWSPVMRQAASCRASLILKVGIERLVKIGSPGEL